MSRNTIVLNMPSNLKRFEVVSLFNDNGAVVERISPWMESEGVFYAKFLNIENGENITLTNRDVMPICQ